MRRECWGRFPHHRLQGKPIVSDPSMHYGTCVKHMSWCMSGSLTHDSGENVPGIPDACATRNFTYLIRGPWDDNGEWNYKVPIQLNSCHCGKIRSKYKNLLVMLTFELLTVHGQQQSFSIDELIFLETGNKIEKEYASLRVNISP